MITSWTGIVLIASSFFLCLCLAITVDYDSKSLIIDGQRKIINAGTIHYTRSTAEVYIYISETFVFTTCQRSGNSRTITWMIILSLTQMWPDLIQKAKDGGLDAIESYIFWDIHEPRRREVWVLLEYLIFSSRN